MEPNQVGVGCEGNLDEVSRKGLSDVKLMETAEK